MTRRPGSVPSLSFPDWSLAQASTRGDGSEGLRPVMRLSTLQTMKGINGGGTDMKSLAIKSPAWHAQQSPTSEGMTRPLPVVESDGRVIYVDTEKCRTLSMRVRLFGGRPLVGRIGGVDSVHTFGHGLGRTGAGLGRIPYVSAGVQCLQGLESGSSPTSGTAFPQVRGVFGLSSCGQCPHSCL